jgi:hypothetical protein
MSGSDLAKAQLISLDNREILKFMFNPTQLSFTRNPNYNKSKGARVKKGTPKTSFASPDAYSLSLKDILFDTYEEGINVLTHVDKFKKAVSFTEGGKDKHKRPPRYRFVWGSQTYFESCVVKSMTYRLTMFKADGTPVRAMLTLKIQEADDAKPSNPRSKGRGSTPPRSK